MILRFSALGAGVAAHFYEDKRLLVPGGWMSMLAEPQTGMNVRRCEFIGLSRAAHHLSVLILFKSSFKMSRAYSDSSYSC